MGAAPDDLRRRRVGLALIGLALVLFVAEMVAIALGPLEVAGLIFLVFAAGWFVLRSYQRRRGTRWGQTTTLRVMPSATVRLRCPAAGGTARPR